jgi:hypothetical protein
MMSNRELIEKATITTDAIAAAGKLNPEQADKFIDFVVQETTMQDRVRVVRFRGEQRLIEKINVANRVAVPKAEAADPGLRRGVSTSKITMQPEEIMCPFEIGDLFKEENIEGDNVEDHIMRMFARRFANNIEELHWLGNVVGPAQLESDLIEGGSSTGYVKDTYLALFNAWLQLAQGAHIVDAQGAAISPNLLSRAINAMPNKFKRNKADLKFMMSADHEQAYREAVSARATQSGDDALAATGNIPAFGIELIPVPLLPVEPLFAEDSLANSDGTTATQLSFAPITDLVLTPDDLGSSATVPFVEGAGQDYTEDLANGQWTRLGAGAIGSGATVKATYKTAGQILLTMPKNMINAIGRDVRLERDRNIFKGVNEFALTSKVWAGYEELDAVVLIKNVAVPS